MPPTLGEYRYACIGTGLGDLERNMGWKWNSDSQLRPCPGRVFAYIAREPRAIHVHTSRMGMRHDA